MNNINDLYINILRSNERVVTAAQQVVSSNGSKQGCNFTLSQAHIDLLDSIVQETTVFDSRSAVVRFLISGIAESLGQRKELVTDPPPLNESDEQKNTDNGTEK